MQQSLSLFTLPLFIVLTSCGATPAPEKPAPTVAATPATQPQDGAALVKAAHSIRRESLKIDTGEPIERAPGETGHTIAELHVGKTDLEGKEVSIRGKVTKYNPGIMGRNWIHMQDGSGTEDGNDYEITVTTQESTSVGEIVLVKGKLGVNRNFGAGYSYSIIVEDATVTK